MRGCSVLVVEDDPGAAQYMAAVLAHEFEHFRAAPEGLAALLAMESRLPDLVVLDLRLPDMDGLELLTLIKQRWPHVPVIFVTAAGDAATIVEAVQRGATNYLVKPVSPDLLLASARKALAACSIVQSPDCSTPEIVGVSKAMVTVRHLIDLAARSDANVLITGETGTGKELVARAIHRLSGHHAVSFIAHNCGTTTQDLFDSEFFGHRRGSFTGADRDYLGLLDRGDGGILFLDELESLGMPQQAKLLRVLDDGELRPVGSPEAHFVCVRFLAATNREPADMMREGSLREDLYYRLRGFEIHIPPLRDRPEDTLPLAAHLLGGSTDLLTPGALSALRECRWPGNVRQLRNALRLGQSLAGAYRIDRHHLSLSPFNADPALPAGSRPPAGTLATDAADSLKDVERRAIIRTLSDFGGNRIQASRALGINRSTLRRKMRDYGIGPPSYSAPASGSSGGRSHEQ